MVELDSGEKRLNELGYKQELRREMVIGLFSSSSSSSSSSSNLFFGCADAVQDAGDIVLDDDAVHGDHAAVRLELAVRGTSESGVGLGRRLLLHLVRRCRHGRDLLLFPRKRFRCLDLHPSHML